MYRYIVYKIDIGKLIFVKKKNLFDRNIKKNYSLLVGTLFSD
jgi:hypothetical protein